MVYRRGAGLFQSSGLPVYSGGVSGSSKGSGAGGVAAGFFPAVFLAGGASCSPTGLRFLVLWYRKKCRMALF